MGRVRYARSARDLERDGGAEDAVLASRVRTLRVVYETDAEVAQAVVPKPLEATTDPCVQLSFSSLSRLDSPELTTRIDVASFGVRVVYDGVEGVLPISMHATSEQAMVAGRERFGLPIKLARVDVDTRGELVTGRVERMGIAFLAASGRRVETLPAREETELGYAFKTFPSCQKTKGFDLDPQLLRLEWRHRFHAVWRLEGAVELVDSAFDPVVDLPVRRLVEIELCEGVTETRGRVLRPVPGEWLLPYLHQRTDSPETEGLEV